MVKKEEILVKQEYVSLIVCDVCGKGYNVSEDMMEAQEFQQIRFTGGYGSVFSDGVIMELDICQHCLKEKLGEYMREVGEEW
jgi:ribulose bisphosphate carboxylase small subunit